MDARRERNGQEKTPAAGAGKTDSADIVVATRRGKHLATQYHRAQQLI